MTVVIESCYAGNFNIDGVKGTGRTVMGSSDDEPAEATGGGVFTSSFNDASRSEGSDVNDDDIVSPSEAFDVAENSVAKNNDKPHRKKKEDQEPWKDSKECECKCPNIPNITGGKYVWDGAAWVNEISALVDSIVQFNIDVENNGATKNILGLTVVDSLPSYLSYIEGSATLFYNGESMGLRNPCLMSDTASGIDLTWGLTEIPTFAPDDTIYIQYSATVLMDGTYSNLFTASGYCETDTSIIVSCEDTATVIAS
jgi:uncharacterized repeat protein (TIGR01451 family)